MPEVGRNYILHCVGVKRRRFLLPARELATAVPDCGIPAPTSFVLRTNPSGYIRLRPQIRIFS